MAGKIYGQPFGIDVALGKLLIGEPDSIQVLNPLKLWGTEPYEVQLYPLELHMAEKLHAITLPRTRPNSRVKDLPDIALLAQLKAYESPLLRNVFEKTFTARNTHPLPETFPTPPSTWEQPFKNMASENAWAWKDLDEITVVVRKFIDPILSNQEEAIWNPNRIQWEKT